MKNSNLTSYSGSKGLSAFLSKKRARPVGPISLFPFNVTEGPSYGKRQRETDKQIMKRKK